MSIVLDAGALIAIERNDRNVWAALKRAALRSEHVIVPSTALAQVWRAAASQAQLAKVLKYCVLAPFDGLAREVGALCGRAKVADICDAHVALVASREGEQLYTSDVADMQALLRIIGARRPAIIRC